MNRCFFDRSVCSMRVSRRFRITDRPNEGVNMYLQAYEKGPCICCGAEDHALMSTARTRGRFRGREYLCPIAVHRELYQAPYNFLCIDFYPCPKKLAEVCRYDFGKAQRKMRRLLTRGAGRRMIFAQWSLFWGEVETCCEARGAEQEGEQVQG